MLNPLIYIYETPVFNQTIKPFGFEGCLKTNALSLKVKNTVFI